jgi:PAS domain S-box-containing protein
MHDAHWFDPSEPELRSGACGQAATDTVFEALPIPVIGIARGVIVSWNPAARAWFGFSREEIVGRALSAMVPGARLEQALALVDRASRGESIGPHRTERAHKDGGWVPVTVTLIPLRDRSGVVLETAGYAPAEAEERLWKSEDAFEALVERCPEPIFVHQQGTLLYVNGAFREWTGYAASQLIGRRMQDVLIHPEDRDGFLLKMQEVETAAGPLPPRETRFLRRDRSTGIAETIPVRIDWCGQQATLVVGRDVTERKRLQSRLMISDRMASIGTLAAGVAHEINNPLTFVLANLESASVLLQALDAPAERLQGIERLLSVARDGAERIARIVRGLKIFSRADEEDRVPLDLHQVLETAINMSFNEIRHRARLVRDYGRPPTVEADEARLCQVFINLLVNAAQSIREGEVELNEIRVATSTDERGRAVVVVRDTGAGIPRELRERIFDPFFTTKPTGEGTGLGLSIVLGIVHELHGEIAVESEPGNGTVFRIALPPARGLPAPERSPARPILSAPRRGRILVVDDDAAVAAGVATMLTDHEITIANGGVEALALILAGDYEVIVCDLMMPAMSGMELYHKLSRARLEMTRRFIFVTGGAFTPGAREFLDTTAVRRLEKPFRSGDLRALVNTMLAQRTAD